MGMDYNQLHQMQDMMKARELMQQSAQDPAIQHTNQPTDPSNLPPATGSHPLAAASEQTPDPMEVLQEVVLAYMDFAMGVRQDNTLNTQVKSKTLLEAAQSLSSLVPLLSSGAQNQQAELIMKAQAHQQDMQMKHEAHVAQIQQAQEKHQMELEKMKHDLAATALKSQQDQQLQQEKHQQQIVHQQDNHEQQLQQQKQAAQLKQSQNQSQKGGNGGASPKPKQ